VTLSVTLTLVSVCITARYRTSFYFVVACYLCAVSPFEFSVQLVLILLIQFDFIGLVSVKVLCVISMLASIVVDRWLLLRPSLELLADVVVPLLYAFVWCV